MDEDRDIRMSMGEWSEWDDEEWEDSTRGSDFGLNTDEENRMLDDESDEDVVMEE